ncbi:MAG: efflux RND transporter periplasmic adaptor subunit [bacterium]
MSEKRADRADLSALRIRRDNEGSSNSPSHLRDRLIRTGAVFAILVFFAIYIMSRIPESSPAVQVAQVTKVYPAQLAAILTATGYVVAQRQAAIASKGTGQLEFLGVEEGDRVKKGEIIARLEHEDVDAALAQARATLEMARATLQQAEAERDEAQLNHQRQQNLLKKGLISQSEYDIAQARFKSRDAAVAAARAQVALSEAAVVSAEVEVENTRIRAPFDGTVLTKNADIGEMVAPFAASANSRGAVVTLADMNSLEVEADVSESNIQRVKVGQSCEIIIDAFPEVRYPGYVHKIVPTADRAKATVLTKIRFKERDDRVLPEMSAKVNFLSETSANDHSTQPFNAVPESAVVQRGGRPVVFVVMGSKVAETPVQTGRKTAGQIEIISGLTADDKVIINPSNGLETGTEIRVE